MNSKMGKAKFGPTESLTHSKSCWKSSGVLIVGNLRCIFSPQESCHLLNQLREHEPSAYTLCASSVLKAAHVYLMNVCRDSLPSLYYYS